MSSVGQFWFPMVNLSAFWSQFRSALSATERVFALIDAEPAVYQTGSEPVESIEGEIRFEGVSFLSLALTQVVRDKL